MAPRAAAGRSGWFSAALVFAVAGSMAIFWAAFCSVPGIHWNPPRLAPAFALAAGLNIYALPDSGAQLGWIYGPVFVLWSLPAVLAKNLTLAFTVWGLLNFAAIFVPVWLVLQDRFGKTRQSWGALALFTVLLLAYDVTQSMLFFIHVDALCVGFGTLATWFLVRALIRPDCRHYIHGVAWCLALAIWTKQLAVSLVPAFVFWLWSVRRPRLAWQLLLWLIVYGSGLSVVFAFWFGREELIFNLWLANALKPNKGSGFYLASELWQLLQLTWVWVVAIVLTAWSVRQRATEATELAGPVDHYQSLLAWIGAACLPLGLAATLKVGGGLNSLHSLNYFLLWASIWMAEKLLAPADLTRCPPVPLKPVMLFFVIIILGLASGFYDLAHRERVWSPSRDQESLMQIARQNTGRIYFPWNPLVTIITDKKIYPFDDALYCLWLAGLEPSAEQIHAAAPTSPYIFYAEPAQSHFALRYFPAHTGPTGKNIGTRQ
jgi:hypothetical protein